MKVVINACYGGFGLSTEAKIFMGIDDNVETYTKEFRTSVVLINCVETLEERANGKHAELVIVEVPDNVNWHVKDYDGIEHIAEHHRTWYAPNKPVKADESNG